MAGGGQRLQSFDAVGLGEGAESQRFIGRVETGSLGKISAFAELAASRLQSGPCEQHVCARPSF